MPYELFTHRHNFSVWTSARSVQRGFGGANTQNLRSALEASRIQNFVSDPVSLHTELACFEELHRLWCSRVRARLIELEVRDVTYGRSAKLIAVYLKTMVVVGSGAYSSLGRVAHPPIDENLLGNLAQAPGIGSLHQQGWGNINWTQLGEQAYYELVGQLREVIPQELPFWMLEEYWTIVNDG